MPESAECHTKTQTSYTWLIDRKFAYFIEALKTARKILTWEQLRTKVNYTFKVTVGALTDAKITDVEFAMRNIRQTIATSFLMTEAEAKVMKEEPPPNPL